jgi:hypothetical protein
MDITQALAPNSDQLDAIELVEPRTFTIDEGSRIGKRDGKTVVEMRLVNFDRVWRPSKGMLDVLAACWGLKGTEWVGRRVTVYNDPDVMYGKEKRGGVRISHLSHIEAARDITIRASGAGRKQTWHVEPLPDAPTARNWQQEISLAASDLSALEALGKAAKQAGAGDDVVGQIRAAYMNAKGGDA